MSMGNRFTVPRQSPPATRVLEEMTSINLQTPMGWWTVMSTLPKSIARDGGFELVADLEIVRQTASAWKSRVEVGQSNQRTT